jgi:hypothetical protein
MTKTQQSKSVEAGKILLPHEEPITSDLVLRSQLLTEKIISEVSKRNDEEFGEIEGIDRWATSTPYGYARKKIKASAVFVDNIDETYRKRKKTNWLNAVQNKRSGVFYSLKNLVDSGVIAESEREFFNLPEKIQDFPYRQINNIYRIMKMDGSEWISTIEQFVGISSQAAIVTCPVDDLMWFVRPKVTYELRTVEGTLLPQGTNIAEQVTKKAAIIKTTGFLGEVIGDRVHTHEWNEEVFRSCLKMIRGNVGDAYNGCALTLKKEGEVNDSISVKTVEDMLLPFDQIWEKNRSTQPITRIDSKQLLKDLTDASAVLQTKTDVTQQYQ